MDYRAGPCLSRAEGRERSKATTRDPEHNYQYDNGNFLMCCEREISLIGLCPLTLSAQLVGLYGRVMEPLGRELLLEGTIQPDGREKQQSSHPAVTGQARYAFSCNSGTTVKVITVVSGMKTHSTRECISSAGQKPITKEIRGLGEFIAIS